MSHSRFTSTAAPRYRPPNNDPLTEQHPSPTSGHTRHVKKKHLVSRHPVTKPLPGNHRRVPLQCVRKHPTSKQHLTPIALVTVLPNYFPLARVRITRPPVERTAPITPITEHPEEYPVTRHDEDDTLLNTPQQSYGTDLGVYLD
ncbi:hypothetical protein BDK51DRAFT_48007 [Blyttiomyces helicus]|uniref:Uncharacterized protein n=1 Tax=Blyttiomyces helicus TaxID=388810 RepID=A0A4P9W4X8_9FUNG|nr:hypothetical protein BDK51DRAFT_48007 [Blyttiomyces helicus]|eukprot:RKO86353.1 hypothetical protein BDK51DRAFT_48007 [Blyttiomyces helicus]